LQNLDTVIPRDIILADPKYPDQTNPKVRPLLVISNQIFHQNSRFCICVGMTSSKDQDPYAIPYRNKDVLNGELDSDGHIVCRRLVALRSDKVLRRIGTQIKDEIYLKVIQKLQNDIIETNPQRVV